MALTSALIGFPNSSVTIFDEVSTSQAALALSIGNLDGCDGGFLIDATTSATLVLIGMGLRTMG